MMGMGTHEIVLEELRLSGFVCADWRRIGPRRTLLGNTLFILLAS